MINSEPFPRVSPCPSSILIILTALLATSNLSAALQSQPQQQNSIKNIQTVKNLRPVIPRYIYRSATLDNLSEKDAQTLLDGSAFAIDDEDGVDLKPLAAVIDLRNSDEIRKGQVKRTDGSKYFYSSLNNASCGGRLIHVPILRDVNAFWDEAIDRMDPGARIAATLQTAFKGGALDRAAARNLEEGGLPMLYTVMMSTAQQPLRMALEACLEESLKGPVIIHCQKGKDRTGVLSMLIEKCVNKMDTEIIDNYSLSGDLLGGDDAATASRSSDADFASSSDSGGMVDWSHFRGSPSSAMEDTLEWIYQRYGSVEKYMDTISFDDQRRKIFRERV